MSELKSFMRPPSKTPEDAWLGLHRMRAYIRHSFQDHGGYAFFNPNSSQDALSLGCVEDVVVLTRDPVHPKRPSSLFIVDAAAHAICLYRAFPDKRRVDRAVFDSGYTKVLEDVVRRPGATPPPGFLEDALYNILREGESGDDHVPVCAAEVSDLVTYARQGVPMTLDDVLLWSPPRPAV